MRQDERAKLTPDVVPFGHVVIRQPRGLAAVLRDRGITERAVALFGLELRLTPDALLARHRDATGATVTWEAIRPEPQGRWSYRRTRGAPTGLFSSPGPGCRLVLCDGPLQAIAAAAVEGAPAGTVYAAPGGAWTAAAEMAVLRRIGLGRVRRVALAFGRHDAGLRSRDAALDALLGVPGLTLVDASPVAPWTALAMEEAMPDRGRGA